MLSCYHISSIEIQGFKSINGPLRLQLEKGYLIGIVGPNGSGKSNILDAVCFAMAPSSSTQRVSVLKELRNNINSKVSPLHFSSSGLFSEMCCYDRFVN